MNVKILRLYINACKEAGIEPSFEGLKQFNRSKKMSLAS